MRPDTATAHRARDYAAALLLARIDSGARTGEVLADIVDNVTFDTEALATLLVAQATLTTCVLQAWMADVRAAGYLPPPLLMAAEHVIEKVRDQGITI